jgi:hypothetical protein
VNRLSLLNFVPTREMADQAGPAHFEALLESALQAYEKKSGVKLAQHPLSMELQRCHVVHDLETFLRGQVEAFNDFRESDRMLKAIKTIVSILTPLSGATGLADGAGLVGQKRRRRASCLTIFTDIYPTCKGDTR